MKENIFKVLAILIVMLAIFGGVYVCVEQHNTYKALTTGTTRPALKNYQEESEGKQLLTKDNGMCKIVFTTDENYLEVYNALRELAIMHDLEEFKDPCVNECIIEELNANYNKTVTSLHVTWVCNTFSQWRKIRKN